MTLEYNKCLVTLATVNFNLMTSFYQKLFDKNPHIYIDNSYAEYQLKGLILGIFKPRKNEQDNFVNTSKSTISLCIEVTDLNQSIESLKVLGLTLSQNIIKDIHGEELYIYDPDGNRLILYQRF